MTAAGSQISTHLPTCEIRLPGMADPPRPSPSCAGAQQVLKRWPTVHNPMDCSPPGSSIHGIFQPRVPEWSALAFSSSYERYSHG